MNEVIRDIFRKDFDIARQNGINDANKRVATDMLKNGEPLEKVKMYSRLTEDTIRNLAQSLDLSVI